MFGNYDSGEEGFAGALLGKCKVCGKKAKYAIRANEGSTEGICRLRMDLCEEDFQAFKALHKPTKLK